MRLVFAQNLRTN